MNSEHMIRQKYIDFLKRYESEKNPAQKVLKKHLFIDWITDHHGELTAAELEYLQAGICRVEDIYY